MSVVSQIKGLGTSGHAEAGIYVLMLGLLFSDLIPTPSDAAYFSYTRKLRDQYANKEITPKQYWEKTAGAYYLFNAIWWILLFVIVIMVGGGATNKLKVLLALLGSGAVIGVVYTNIKKDELAQSLAAEALIPKA